MDRFLLTVNSRTCCSICSARGKDPNVPVLAFLRDEYGIGALLLAQYALTDILSLSQPTFLIVLQSQVE